MSKRLEFYFDFVSPAAYLAYTQLASLVEETNTELVLIPTLIGGIFKHTGNSAPMTVPAKGRYIFRDFMRFAARYQVKMNMNPHFPVNTLTAMRLAVALQKKYPEQFDTYVRAMFEAMWVEGKNLADTAVIAEVLTSHNLLETDAALELANSSDIKEALIQHTQEAANRGVFGLPTMFVGDEMFWGQDRLDFVREELMKP